MRTEGSVGGAQFVIDTGYHPSGGIHAELIAPDGGVYRNLVRDLTMLNLVCCDSSDVKRSYGCEVTGTQVVVLFPSESDGGADVDAGSIELSLTYE